MGVFLSPLVILFDFWLSSVMFNMRRKFCVGNFVYELRIDDDSIFVKYRDGEDVDQEVSLPIAYYSINIETYPQCVKARTKHKKGMCIMNIVKRHWKKDEMHPFVNYFYQYNILGWKTSDFRKIKEEYLAVCGANKKSEQ